MKDHHLRWVVKLLSQRIDYLSKELVMLRNPHPKDCKCEWCEGWVADPFIMAIGRYGEISREILGKDVQFPSTVHHDLPISIHLEHEPKTPQPKKEEASS